MMDVKLMKSKQLFIYRKAFKMKMSTIGKVLAVLLFPVISMAQDEKQFKIEGKLVNMTKQPDKILLYYPYREQNYMDSVDVKGDKYKFEGMISGPVRADMYVRYKNSDGKNNMSTDVMTVFLEPGTINIVNNGTLANATVTGSKANDEFKKIRDAAVPFQNQVAPLMEQYKTYTQEKNKEGQAQVSKQINAIKKTMMDDIYGNYVKQNPNSPIALFALQQYEGVNIKNPNEATKLFWTLPADVQASRDGQKFQQLIRMAKMAPVGSAAPDFVQNDTLGNPVSLSSYRGNYVLIDFWASWCGPCRAENPGLVALYDKYHGKGFNVLGVSLDKPGEMDNWLEAIDKDKLPWKNVSDLQFWNNAAAKKYGIVSAPQNFLIDPNGKIVARDLKVDELGEKLTTLYSN